MSKLKTTLLTFLFSGLMATQAYAGPGSVEIKTGGEVTIKMGAQVRIVPTSESNRDFGLGNTLNKAQEAKAAAAMGALGVGTDSTSVHLNEAAGAVKDNYIRGENRLFFNFIKGTDWDVYMALESDTILDRKSADRTDFATGRQSQQFGIERLMATFNLKAINSRVQAGWDALGVDIPYGGLVYGDDDPGIGLVGKSGNISWDVRMLKKDEDEAGYYTDAQNVNPIGAANQDHESDRTFYYAKMGYNFSKTNVLEGFYFRDTNHLNTMQTDRNFIGVQGKGQFDIIKPLFEIVYNFGDFEKPGVESKDIGAWAMFADVEFDLKKYVGMKSFDIHFGGYYLSGDEDLTDNDLEGFASAVSIDRFSPRFGSEQSISQDGNPIFGQTLYSMFPIYYGSSYRAGGINGGAALDNPGFVMFGAGLKMTQGKWSYNTNLYAMNFDTSEPVEYYFMNGRPTLGNVEVDEFMGVEWNNEIHYKLYDAVTIKGGAAFLFPGSGAKDITKALDAIARGVSFDEGKESDDISMRLAAELLWFF